MKALTRKISCQKEQEATLRGIWQSVILQAILDATSQSEKSSMNKARAEARAWFCLENEDFTEVCSLADMDPHRVMRGAYREIKRAQRKKKHGESLQKKRSVIKKERPSVGLKRNERKTTVFHTTEETVRIHQPT